MRSALFRWIWARRFRSAAWNGQEPTLFRVTGWRSCLWTTAEGNIHRVTFEPAWWPW